MGRCHECSEFSNLILTELSYRKVDGALEKSYICWYATVMILLDDSLTLGVASIFHTPHSSVRALIELCHVL